MLKESSSTHILPSISEKGRYMPGLDGLRALSVLAVMAYHLEFPWAQGGFLGVGIFFTLSGYLITDQLMMQWKRSGRLNLKNFWIRRVRRLLPAMFFMLTVVFLWLYCFDRTRLISLKSDFLSVILYFNNWWLIFHNVSYFQTYGPPSPIGNMWSLAIEEQFYLLWPLVLTLLLRLIPRQNSRVLIILIGAAVSALAMALIYEPGSDPSRVYYGTDTRAFALLIGAALAMVWPSQNLRGHLTGCAQTILEFIGIAGLLAIILVIGVTNEFDSWLYTYGLAVFAILSAIVIAVMAHPASLLSKVIGCKPLRWVGVRSYGLYLWHYPVIILTRPTVNTGDFNAYLAIFQMGLSLLLAAISWRFIEKPIQCGHVRPALRKDRQVITKPRYALILLASVLIVTLTPSSGHTMYNHAQKSSPATEDIINKHPLPNETQESAAGSKKKIATSQCLADKNSITKPLVKVQSGQGITAIGDSVMLDVAPYLQNLLPGIIIDGKVGRQMAEAQSIVTRLKAENRLGNIVIIELGTNGAFSEQQLYSLLRSLEDVDQILLVNTRVPRMWQNTVNSNLQSVAAQVPNAILVDWFNASKNQNSFFSPDGVHLAPKGAEYYASMLSQSIRKGNNK